MPRKSMPKEGAVDTRTSGDEEEEEEDEEDEEDEEEEEEMFPHESSPSQKVVSQSPKDATPTASTTTVLPPAAKFQPMDKVIARDRDGVVYEAVVRRAMYGRGQAESIQLGFCSHAEAQLLQQQQQEQQEAPCWHYFIHYNQWRPNWDRWVREYDVYETNNDTREYASQVMAAHKQLRQEMTKKAKGKKSFQTIDGTKFLQQWRKRLNAIDVALGIYNPRFVDPTTVVALQKSNDNKDKKSANDNDTTPMFNKTALLEERQLREKGLTKKRRDNCTDANNMINLPFGLKKALVDQWEIITQCGMLTDLPGKVTVRHALNEYLKAKGIVDPEYLCKDKDDSTKHDVATTLNPAEVMAETTSTARESVGKQTSAKHAPPCPVEGASNGTQETAASQPEDGPTPMDVDSPSKEISAAPKSGKLAPPDMSVGKSPESTTAKTNEMTGEKQKDEETSENAQGWIDMANGVAQFFDEALPCRLLYREEYPQLRVIQKSEVLAETPYSEIYGCEYLLRMLTRLSDVLLQQLSAEECRPMFAKLNDLARFLHKNQSHFLAAYHRKPNGDEQMEAMRMEARQHKKRNRGQGELSTKKMTAKKAKAAGNTENEMATPSNEGDA